MSPTPHVRRAGDPRWIVIGVLRVGQYVTVRNWGCPNGFRMIWRGRAALFQPCEFLRWEEVWWAIRRRLQRARLWAVAVACDVDGLCRETAGICTPFGKWDVTLRVLVARQVEVHSPSEEEFYE